MYDYSATFACYNNVDYTKKCINSLLQTGFPIEKLVVVDNYSQDDTLAYLKSIVGLQVIKNRANMGCGVAWNQGVLAQQTEWTVIMNNDIVVSQGWVEALIAQAIEQKLRVASPAYLEGPLDYDFQASVQQFQQTMHGYARYGYANAICLLVHRSVWQEVGYFRATPKLLGFEDTIFFNDLRKAGIEHACLANSWIHHFGSVTVKAMNKAHREKTGEKHMASRYNYRVLHQSFLERKLLKFEKKRRLAKARANELKQYGMTVHGVRDETQFCWF